MLEDMLKRQLPTEASTMFIDMDSFFASVEQQYNPNLRGKPVGVCSCLGEGCAVVAASIEAKKFGVRVGTRVRDARRMCPGIVLVSDSPAKYREVHYKIMKILDDTPCNIRSKSIDEAWLKLPFYMIGTGTALKLACDIKAQLKAQVGEYIGCSMGIAPNIWLAKMAATFDKPNGLLELKLADLKGFYTKLQLTQLNGISRGLSRQCYGMGINSVIDLYNAPLSLLRKKWGTVGDKWYLRMRGFEVDVSVIKPQQTMSHQTTLMPKPAQNRAELDGVLTKMSFKLGSRLRRNNQMARGVAVYLRFENRSYFHNNYHSLTSFSSNTAILEHIRRMLSKLKFEPVRRASLVLYGLCDELQLSLALENNKRDELALSRAIDRINERYGAYTIAPASSLGKDMFPDRIGFGNSRA